MKELRNLWKMATSQTPDLGARRGVWDHSKNSAGGMEGEGPMELAEDGNNPDPAPRRRLHT